ncbi:hypothetical protein E5D57_008294 [Metarhizium anisopliae]|nr:hypothetical protein E5D57_008294 [Metarhizium anisopliae]
MSRSGGETDKTIEGQPDLKHIATRSSNPTPQYISKSVEKKRVKQHFESKNYQNSVYTTTGLAIARETSSSTQNANTSDNG